ncbi:hypothetical protein OC709_02390 ['Planchonia careya' phytoplasma]|nr:hypothetical protein ['Planchonia careya' phytoplasma]MDO8030342.1 hypothetical protein ['Planchonia careya' phytoplasma]
MQMTTMMIKGSRGFEGIKWLLNEVTLGERIESEIESMSASHDYQSSPEWALCPVKGRYHQTSIGIYKASELEDVFVNNQNLVPPSEKIRGGGGGKERMREVAKANMLAGMREIGKCGGKDKMVNLAAIRVGGRLVMVVAPIISLSHPLALGFSLSPCKVLGL